MSIVRPSVYSVRLSVMMLLDRDQIGWKSWKLIARTTSPKLFLAQRSSTFPTRGTWGNLGETRGRVGKVVCWSTKAAISLKRVKIEEKLPWRAYRKSPTLFRTVPSRPHMASSSPRLGVRKPKTSIAIVPGTGKATDF